MLTCHAKSRDSKALGHAKWKTPTRFSATSAPVLEQCRLDHPMVGMDLAHPKPVPQHVLAEPDITIVPGFTHSFPELWFHPLIGPISKVLCLTENNYCNFGAKWSKAQFASEFPCLFNDYSCPRPAKADFSRSRVKIIHTPLPRQWAANRPMPD